MPRPRSVTIQAGVSPETAKYLRERCQRKGALISIRELAGRVLQEYVEREQTPDRSPTSPAMSSMDVPAAPRVRRHSKESPK